MKNKHIHFALIAAVLMALILSGCQTPPPKGGVGFPLIDIVDAEVDLDDSQFAKDEVSWVRTANTKIVGGTLETRIAAKDLTIRLIETTIQIPIREGADLSDWFLNIPRGLRAIAHAQDREAKFAAKKGDTEVTVTIDGTPKQTINQPIKIQVPYEVTNRSWDFIVPPNPDIRFEVYGVVIADVVVGGAVSRPIESKTFRLKIAGANLADTIPMGTDITAWFTNIPRGLTAIVPEEASPATEGQQSLMVTISGTSVMQRSENMRVTIPAGVTTAGIPVTIAPTDKARYDIGSYEASSASDYEVRTGTNWTGDLNNWGLTGPQVFQVKDFTPVGIIQIQAVSTYAIGEDGEPHWTGDTITYGNLMAEARRLNAHAIIDVVIDSDDVVDVALVRRHVERGHAPTTREKNLIASGKIIRSPDLNDPMGGEIYEERVEVTKRTWTGTALAITYAPAYQPAVGDGGAAGYVPSLPGSTSTRPSTSKPEEKSASPFSSRSPAR